MNALRPLGVAAAVAITFASGDAAAAERRRLAWPELYPRFHKAEYAATLMMAVASAYVELGVDTQFDVRWRGPILFDGAVRTFRIRDREVRDSAWLEAVSDAPLYLAQLGAIILDPAVAVVDGSFDTAWQMSMINAEAFGITELLTRPSLKLMGRQRPDAYTCESDPEYSTKCNRGPTSSFPSGHTSFAFTGAALTCAHHHGLALYGNKTADTAACVAAMSMAVTTTVTRILMDRHWFSDVFVGAAIGLGAGFGVPYLLHYKAVERALTLRAAHARATLIPTAYGGGAGAALFGSF